MAGRTPSEAVENFLAPLRLALSCVTREILLVSGGYHPSDTPHALTISNSPVRLGRDRRYALRLIQHYRIVEDDSPRGPWEVQIAAYYYTIEAARDPGGEIFGYHWHPQGKSAVTYPHFHLHEGAGIGQHGVSEAHFPTGGLRSKTCFDWSLRNLPLSHCGKSGTRFCPEHKPSCEPW
jgi:hypothetical protein